MTNELFVELQDWNSSMETRKHPLPAMSDDDLHPPKRRRLSGTDDISSDSSSGLEHFKKKKGGMALQKEFTSCEQTFLQSKASLGVHHEATLAALRRLALLAFDLAQTHRPQPWANFLHLLKRALRGSKEVYDTATYVLNEITSVFLEKGKRGRCIQIYETMLVAAHGTGVQLTQVLNHLSWCLYLSNGNEECSDILLSMEVDNTLCPIQFSGIYHTALCLKKEGNSKPLRKWEEHLKNRASNLEAEKEDDRMTLTCVSEIAKHVLEDAQREGGVDRQVSDPVGEVTKVFDLVLAAFNARLGHESDLSKQARSDKFRVLETLEALELLDSD